MNLYRKLVLNLCVLLAAVFYVSAVSADIAVSQYNGFPVISDNNEPCYPLLLFQQEISSNDADEFCDAGFDFYSCIEKYSYLDLGWIGNQQFDFDLFDRVMLEFVKNLPEGGYLIPRVHVWAPEWWVDANPNEAIGYLIQPQPHQWLAGDGTKHESFASSLWKQEAGYGLRLLVRHILNSPYANRIAGLHIANGVYGEWHMWGAEYVPDTGSSMLAYFRDYLRTKYNNDVTSLRNAWNWPYVIFDTAPIPNQTERTARSDGLFCDSQWSRVTDYYEAHNKAAVDAIDYFCQIVKDESNNKLLTSVLYGYQPDMPHHPLEVDHRGAAQAYRLSSVDMFASPHSYWYRDLGQDASFRHFPESLRVNGKLFMDEADVRTHLCDSSNLFRHATNIDESLAVLRRAFGNMLTGSVGGWFMDQSSGLWYDDPSIYHDFANYKRWADYSLAWSRERINDVAIISSLNSEFYIGAEDQLTAQFYVKQIPQLCRAAAPFNRYLIEDLEEGLVPEHKVYIFIDCFYLTDSQRTAINNLKTNGHTLLWMFAPGFAGPSGLSVTAMESLTGISFTKTNNWYSDVYPDQNLFPTSPDTYNTYQTNFGSLTSLSPKFSPVASSCQVWGTWQDNGQGGAALVVKDYSNWRSIYSPTAGLPWVILNKIYEDAGVHLYAQAGDNLMVNQSFVGIHSVSGGSKTIKLPQSSNVYDVINNTSIASNVTQFTFTLGAERTALFAIADNIGSSAVWTNASGDHSWSQSGNWSGSTPVATPKSVLFDSHTGTVDQTYAHIHNGITGGAQAVDMLLGRTGHDSRILHTDGENRFRTLFVGLDSDEIHSDYHMYGGKVESYFDGTWGGKMHVGYSSNSLSSGAFYQLGGVVNLSKWLEVGYSGGSYGHLQIEKGLFKVPDFSIYNGIVDVKGGWLVLDSETNFRNYANQGKILVNGSAGNENSFCYRQRNNKIYISIPSSVTWSSSAGDHLFSNPANWVEQKAPQGTPMQVNFSVHSDGWNDYCLIDETAKWEYGGIDAVDVLAGRDGKDTKIIQTGGVFEFRNMFFGMDSLEIHTQYHMYGGILRSFYDGSFGGQMVLGAGSNANSDNVFYHEAGAVILDSWLYVGDSSAGYLILHDGIFIVPNLTVNQGHVDISGGTLVLNWDTEFRQYANQGKILAYGLSGNENSFNYKQVKDQIHITAK
ncbi:MAG: hypothetical protein ACIAQZ_15710 [Sedimentisphaeraceae bacterium JB056]